MRKIKFFELQNPLFWLIDVIGLSDLQSRYVYDAMQKHSKVSSAIFFVVGVLVGMVL